MAPHKSISRFSCGQLHVSALSMPAAIDTFFDLIVEKRGGYIACTCSHGVVEVQRDNKLRQILDAAVLALPDGMPLVWLGRLKGVAVERITASDFLEAIMRDPRGRTIRHYFYGASPDVLDRIVQRARAMVGTDAVVGWHSPAFRPVGEAEDPALIAAIADAKPDVIWVGLGLPKQEYWMANYAPQFPSSVMIGVGAAFDFFAGSQPRAHVFIQGLGLEWLHRLMKNPARMWPRYRDVVPKALAILLKDAVSNWRASLTG